MKRTRGERIKRLYGPFEQMSIRDALSMRSSSGMRNNPRCVIEKRLHWLRNCHIWVNLLHESDCLFLYSGNSFLGIKIPPPFHFARIVHIDGARHVGVEIVRRTIRKHVSVISHSCRARRLSPFENGIVRNRFIKSFGPDLSYSHATIRVDCSIL